MNYDIIGDIHGHAEALKALLKDLGYVEKGRFWSHPDRQAIFLGDFIDRRPKQVETVDIVRQRVEAESAQAGSPLLLADSTACLDYGIANGGRLVAYRWNGEPRLQNCKRHWIGKDIL